MKALHGFLSGKNVITRSQPRTLKGLGALQALDPSVGQLAPSNTTFYTLKSRSRARRSITARFCRAVKLLCCPASPHFAWRRPAASFQYKMGLQRVNLRPRRVLRPSGPSIPRLVSPSQSLITCPFDAPSFIALRRSMQVYTHSYTHTC